MSEKESIIMTEDDKFHKELMTIIKRLAEKETMTDFESKIFDTVVDHIGEYEKKRWPIINNEEIQTSEKESPQTIEWYEAQIKELQEIQTSEKESPKTIEWYEAQIKELQDIRKAFYEICGDTTKGEDAYFPNLVEKEFKNAKKMQNM